MMIVAVTVGGLPQANAVDIANEGQSPVVVFIDEDGAKSQYEIEGGEVLIDVCTACTIHVNNEVIEAKGRNVVVVSGDTPLSPK